jgi:hypothetical protein
MKKATISMMMMKMMRRIEYRLSNSRGCKEEGSCKLRKREDTAGLERERH